MRYILLIAIVAISFTNCKQKHCYSTKIIGTKIYEYKGDINKLVQEWTNLGINTVFASKNMASNKEFRAQLKEHNIKIFIIFPVFFNEDLLDKDSSFYGVSNLGTKAQLDWVKFVCPSRTDYREQKIKELTQCVKDLQPEGLSIDFIRNFLYWEMIKPNTPADSIVHGCYCNGCLSKFEEETKTKIPDSLITTSTKAAWLKSNANWITWRTNLITSMVRSLNEAAHAAKPDIKINFHAVPWRSTDYNNGRITLASQDLKAISHYVDYISPMCYSWMLYQNPEWVNSVVKEMNTIAPGKILPSIEVNECYREGILSVEEFQKNNKYALAEPSNGVVYWDWAQLDDVPQKKKVIKHN